jgi:hypothetical protein
MSESIHVSEASKQSSSKFGGEKKKNYGAFTKTSKLNLRKAAPSGTYNYKNKVEFPNAKYVSAVKQT